MHLKRFYANTLTADSVEVALSGDEFHHLKNVLRLKEGTEVTLFSGTGLVADGDIISIGKDSAVIKIISVSDRKGLSESPVKIVLLQGLLKGDKSELVVQKATELGVKEIRFFTSPRTVPKLKNSGGGGGGMKDEENEKLKRLKRVGVEAVKQCGRSVLPRISIFSDISNANEGCECAFKVILWKGESAQHLKDILKDFKGNAVICLLIGPEGGFSPEEIKEAAALGFLPASMGPRRLRAETAAIAAISIVGFEAGDLGSL